MRTMSTYIQRKLERASLNPEQFNEELNQSIKILISSEIDELAKWFVHFTKDKPHLKNLQNDTAYNRNLLY
ncbi:hypothetical protein HUE46_00860 [Flavobacterium columnare]|nr:hypothetical protein [Flavobacterium columnare]AMO19167.1 hypothetical protein UN65_01280 [Flavobacterium columnare]ANO48108.1 hypothetical protein Pf1_02654 [Flavobacterium columnare]APT21321.1 hypothetical protein BU993_00925 [Flavobacterium columnare]AUX17104.1 hypothetical protein AQ623_01335 [Flavobacterium columnare]MBF6651558.1 hypothetical protein [Flavobacterium columnare]